MRHHPLAAALGGCLSLAAALGIGRFVYTPILPYMADGLDLSRADAGLIASANFLGYLAGALLVSLGSLPGERRTWLLGGLALAAGSTAAMAGVQTMAMFLALRFASGVAGAVVMVFASAMVMDRLVLAGRLSLAAVLYAGVGTGIAISALVAPLLATAGDDWEPLWLAGGCVAILLAIPVAWLLPDTRPEDRATQHRGHGAVRRSTYWRWILGYGLVGFGYVVTATFITDLMRASPSLRPAEAWVWLVVGVSAIPSVALWTWCGRRWSNRVAFAAASVCEAVGVAVSVLSESIAMLLLAAALLGGTVMGLTALGLVEMARLAASDSRRVLAIMTVSFGLGQMVGPTLAGLLHDATGTYLIASMITAGGLLIGAVATATAPAHADRGP